MYNSGDGTDSAGIGGNRSLAVKVSAALKSLQKPFSWTAISEDMIGVMKVIV